MQYSFALVAGLAAFAVAKPMPQVTADITPTGSYPAGCTGTYSGTFELSVVNASTSSKKMAKRQSSATDALVISLTNGVLTDSKGRTGYIAANKQFQFDAPPQTGAIYTGGFSVCANSTLALGSSAVWYECLSGSFYNLYETSQGAQCYQIYLDAVPYSSSTSSVTTAAVTQSTDGQIEATTAATKGTTTQAILSTISDHQIQAPTSASAVTSTAAVITQITDGQIQATTGTTSKSSSKAVITQITDGQIQATTGTTSKSSSKAVVTQITDGQIQATTAKSSSVAVITQITDGQIQATSSVARNATSTASLTAFTGAAASNNNKMAAAGAFVLGAAAFLA